MSICSHYGLPLEKICEILERMDAQAEAAHNAVRVPDDFPFFWTNGNQVGTPQRLLMHRHKKLNYLRCTLADLPDAPGFQSPPGYRTISHATTARLSFRHEIEELIGTAPDEDQE